MRAKHWCDSRFVITSNDDEANAIRLWMDLLQEVCHLPRLRPIQTELVALSILNKISKHPWHRSPRVFILTTVSGETIPIRLFLGGFDLTPTYREVNKKYSTRYYLSLVLIDEGELSTFLCIPRPSYAACYTPLSVAWCGESE